MEYECLDRHHYPWWKDLICQNSNKYCSVPSSKVKDFNLCVVHTVHTSKERKWSQSQPRMAAEVLETWAMCTEAGNTSSGSNTSEVALPNP
jgi:hypothetical protein